MCPDKNHKIIVLNNKIKLLLNTVFDNILFIKIDLKRPIVL